jgi:hypothetical protein
MWLRVTMALSRRGHNDPGAAKLALTNLAWCGRVTPRE